MFSGHNWDPLEHRALILDRVSSHLYGFLPSIFSWSVNKWNYFLYSSKNLSLVLDLEVPKFNEIWRCCSISSLDTGCCKDPPNVYPLDWTPQPQVVMHMNGDCLRVKCGDTECMCCWFMTVLIQKRENIRCIKARQYYTEVFSESLGDFGRVKTIHVTFLFYFVFTGIHFKSSSLANGNTGLANCRGRQ